jgi:hypothetical protein
VAWDQEIANVNDVEDLRRSGVEQSRARRIRRGWRRRTDRTGFHESSPIGFLWSGTAIVVCSGVTAPKVKALRERPNVALTIDTIGAPAKVLGFEAFEAQVRAT